MRNFWGLSGAWRSTGSLFCSARSKRDHSVLNNGMIYDAAFCQSSLITCCMFTVKERVLRRTRTWWSDCWSGVRSVLVRLYEARVAACSRAWRIVSSCRCRSSPPETRTRGSSCEPWRRWRTTTVATTYSRGVVIIITIRYDNDMVD